MTNVVALSNAREELVRINGFLREPHLLIGGLAVHRYYPARDSSDIDLVCPAKTSMELISQLYPTDRFTVEDQNDDVMRPAWVLRERGSGRTTFIGPKITERDTYAFVDYEWVKANAVPYTAQGQELANLLVPTLESLALLKLLALIARLQRSPEKGKQDVRDFVNLTNLSDFRVNIFLDLIPSDTREHITVRLAQLTAEHEELFSGSSLRTALDCIFPPHAEPLGTGVARVFSPEAAIGFYDEVASLYDSRNTSFLYAAHQVVIGEIRKSLDGGAKGVIDIGCGTGRMIAAHFVHRDIVWLGVDGSSEMLEQFNQNTEVEASPLRAQTQRMDFATADFSQLDIFTSVESWVAVWSFVLTSLPSDEALGRMVAQVSSCDELVIADIHPLYTNSNPNYDFETASGSLVLTPRAVYPDVLEDVLAKAGFSVVTRQLIRKDPSGEPYAFVTRFSAARSLDGAGQDEPANRERHDH